MMAIELKDENPEFRAWVEALPVAHWAKHDLSACRLGWEAGRAAAEQELRDAREALKEVAVLTARLSEAEDALTTGERRGAVDG
jgi:hypothetical protein